MTELDFDRGQPDDFEVKPIHPTTKWTRTHFIVSDEIFESTHMMHLHDRFAEAERKAALSRLAISHHDDTVATEA